MSLVEKFKSWFSQEKTQNVYRFVSQRELELLQENNVESLGVKYPNKKLSNTHKYLEDERYIHFFESSDQPPRVIHSLSNTKQFLCEFEIEKNILSQYKGTGFYPPQGYDEDCTRVTEYAIPVSQYNPEWLVDICPLDNNMQNTTNFVKTTPPEQ